jgi:hypothetical protein
MSSSVRRFGFVSREIIPFVNEWDEAGTFPRHLYRSVAELGATGLGYRIEHRLGDPAQLVARSAIALPMPRLAPVINSVLCFSELIGDCPMFWILPRLVVCPAEVLRPVAGIRRPDLHPRRSNLTQDRPTGAP